jgi:hypothetical protein
MLHSVRASSRAAQPASGIVVPKLNPVPTNATPPETDPRHVSSPAAAKPGATTLGTFLIVCSAGAVLLLMIVAEGLPPTPTPTPVPPCPEIACELDVDLALPTPVAVVVDD